MYENIGQGNVLGLGNVGNFANYSYWSSTEYDNFDRVGADFGNGNQTTTISTHALCACCSGFLVIYQFNYLTLTINLVGVFCTKVVPHPLYSFFLYLFKTYIMKNIFTLIALALLTSGILAQGNLTVTSGGSLTVSATNYLTAAGNFSNNGGTVTLNSTADNFFFSYCARNCNWRHRLQQICKCV